MGLARRPVAPGRTSRPNVRPGATRRRAKRKKVRTLEELLELEIDLRSRGYRYVIGSDDSGGAGCVAGPVVVASCCALKPFSSFLRTTTEEKGSSACSERAVPSSATDALEAVNDCKLLTPDRRREIYDVVRSYPDVFAVSTARRSPEEIDEVNILRATQEAFAESIESLVEEHDLPFDEVYAVVDGKASPKLYASQRSQCDQQATPKIFPARPYVNGDAEVYTVALASIVARVERDEEMFKLHERYPHYGFADHFGYGRRDHVEAIHRHGSLEGVHRMSFKQVKGR
ncbi:hypothetical protein ACHAWF_001479 [Thalassiosira exigua]